jgi:hypothetical protein
VLPVEPAVADAVALTLPPFVTVLFPSPAFTVTALAVAGVATICVSLLLTVAPISTVTSSFRGPVATPSVSTPVQVTMAPVEFDLTVSGKGWGEKADKEGREEGEA